MGRGLLFSFINKIFSRSILVLLFSAFAACKSPMLAVGGSGDGLGTNSQITYSAQIKTIIDNNCVSCHASGEIAPFALDTYEEVSSRAKWIADTVKSRQMPPSNVDNSGDCNKFVNSRWLSEEDILSIEKWALAGAPEGSKDYSKISTGIRRSLDRVDHVLEMSEPYTPSETVTDENRCFLLDQSISAPGLSLSGFEVVPGDIRTVHHIILSVFNSDADVIATRALDAADPRSGFSCFGGIASTTTVGLWAAGGGPVVFPEGTGFPLTQGRPFFMQVHYNSQNGVSPDLTKIKLQLSDTATPIGILFMGAPIPFMLPNTGIIETSNTGIYGLGPTTLTIPVGFSVNIIAVFPHMHKIGSRASMKFVRLEDQKNMCLADVKKWNFNWQDSYFYEEPIVLTPGSYTGTMSCSFDTDNNWIPGVGSVVGGEGSSDEMCLGFIYYTIHQTPL